MGSQGSDSATAGEGASATADGGPCMCSEKQGGGALAPTWVWVLRHCSGGGFTGSMTVSVNGNTGWASQYANASSTPNASPEPFNSRDRHQHSWGGNYSHSYDKTPPFYALAFIMKS